MCALYDTQNMVEFFKVHDKIHVPGFVANSEKSQHLPVRNTETESIKRAPKIFQGERAVGHEETEYGAGNHDREGGNKVVEAQHDTGFNVEQRLHLLNRQVMGEVESFQSVEEGAMVENGSPPRSGEESFPRPAKERIIQKRWVRSGCAGRLPDSR